MSQAKLSNWGRWGADDQRGAVNFITPQHLLAAAGLIREGRVISLALPLHRDTLPSSPLRPLMQHFMTIDGGDFAAGVRVGGDYQCADDWLSMPSQCGTHLDGLAHVWYENELYNGHPANRIRSYGATRLGIENVGPIVTRGVLLDVAAHLGVEHLAGDHVITAAELDACAEKQQTPLRSGDCLLVRTGWYRVFGADREKYYASSPGIGLEAARWVAGKEVCAVGVDNMTVEAAVGAHGFEKGNRDSRVHKLLLRDCGTYLIEMLDLEALAESGRREFLFVAAPLPIVGGVGSPLNPLAIL